MACVLSADVAVAEAPSSPASSPASPQSPSSLTAKARAAVQQHLLQPLKDREKKRSMFSRSPPSPAERRVRILDATPTADGEGRGFVRFAVDERFFDDEWNDDNWTGCVYVGDGAVFVDVGDGYRPAAAMFARTSDAPAEVPTACRPGAAAPASPPPTTMTTPTPTPTPTMPPTTASLLPAKTLD
jgi:hypothetical protein